ncbi:hypothetical protein PTKIN_Ptkin12aG0154000 [Pterospermum kingtungense]
MAAEQAPESIPPRMITSRRSPSLASSICNPDFLELVWENGQILVRGLSSSKITEKGNFPCSSQSFKAPGNGIQREGETSTANRPNDVVPDSMFGEPLPGLTKPDRYDHKHKNSIRSCPKSSCAEVLSEFYGDGFNVVLKPETRCYDKKLVDSTIVPVNRFINSKQSYVSKLVDEIPQQTVNNINGEVPQSSSVKQHEASVRSKEKQSRVDVKSDRSALLISNHPSSGATRPITSSPGIVGAKDLEGDAGSAPAETINDSKNNSRSMGKEENLMGRNMKSVLPDSEPQKDSIPDDEQSEAFGYKDTPQNTKFPNKVDDASSSLAANTAINGKSLEQMVASSSVCSRGASNCPIYTLTRRYEDTDLSENTMEKPEGTTKAAEPRRSKGAKRKRKTEVHNVSERKRRDKINKKMRALQELIPNCNKVDKASMLDEAIEYLKTLKLQVQMMSMGTGVYMPPMMLQHMNAPHLGGYSPMGVGMGMRSMQMGLGQFPSTSLMSGAAALSGFPGQVLLMSMARSPFLSLAGRFSSQLVQTPGVSQAAPAAAASQLKPSATSKDSNPTH